MARHKDLQWNLPSPVENYEQAILAVLMDIRDRLDVLRCFTFLKIPSYLEAIAYNTRRRQRRKRPKRRRGRR